MQIAPRPASGAVIEVKKTAKALRSVLKGEQSMVPHGSRASTTHRTNWTILPAHCACLDAFQRNLTHFICLLRRVSKGAAL